MLCGDYFYIKALLTHFKVRDVELVVGSEVSGVGDLCQFSVRLLAGGI